jgi:predicted nucleic acid-binding protein
MTWVVADTSALVSLGVVAGADPDPIDILLDTVSVFVPDTVLTELESVAAHDDAAAEAATSVLDQRAAMTVESVTLEDSFPLDDGENAAVTLANERGADQLLCDEFNALAVVHASLADSRLVTTPLVLTALVRNDRVDAADAARLLDRIGETRSWDGNSYVERARETLDAES